MRVSDFFRFPHTPHIAWLGEGVSRDDKVLSPDEAAKFLTNDIVVEEKLDGANMGLSISPDGIIRAQNRGQYLREPYQGQFKKLRTWLACREGELFNALGGELVLFGEWCAARHSMDYDALPDWFLVFDVYDQPAQRFWSTKRRDQLARDLDLFTVPHVTKGKFSLHTLVDLLLQRSGTYHSGSIEGFVLRRENNDWLEERVKLVHPDFTQAIEEHWRRRVIEWNRLRAEQRSQRR